MGAKPSPRRSLVLAHLGNIHLMHLWYLANAPRPRPPRHTTTRASRPNAIKTSTPADFAENAKSGKNLRGESPPIPAHRWGPTPPCPFPASRGTAVAPCPCPRLSCPCPRLSAVPTTASTNVKPLVTALVGCPLSCRCPCLALVHCRAVSGFRVHPRLG